MSEKLIWQICALHLPAGCEMTAPEMNAIRDAAKGDLLKVMNYAFRYGFMNGQKSRRAELVPLKQRGKVREFSL